MATEPSVFETKLAGSPSNVGKTMPQLPWRHPVKQGFATVGINRLREPISMYYELHGKGSKKAVFIMGLNATCQTWDYQTTHFGSSGEYTALVFDARGVGWTDGDWDWYNTTEWAEDVLDLLDYIGWRENIHIVGHSAGGEVLLKMLLSKRSIGRFLSASLLNTTAGGIPPFTGAWIIISNAFIKDPQVQMERLVRVNYTESWLKERPDDDVSFNTNYEKVCARIKQRQSRSRPQKLGAMISQSIAALRHWVTESELASIRQSRLPILVATNSWDNFIHSSHSYYLRDKLQPRHFVVFENTGHIVPTARHAELNKLLQDFWEQIDSERAAAED